MSGIGWAITAGVLFGLFQAVYRKANRSFDAFRVTFGVLLTGTTVLVALALITQDLGVLAKAPAVAFLWAAAAGVIHFFFGWTFLAISQQQIGASRTGIVVAATPLLGSLLAAVLLGERVRSVTILGVVLVAGGVAALSRRGKVDKGVPGVLPWFALATAASWGISPLFIRRGLEGLPVPMIAVTVAMTAATTGYLVMMICGRIRGRMTRLLPAQDLGWIVIAGGLVAAAIAAQWTSYEHTPIAVAISLMQLSTPVVVLIAPLLVGTEMEKLTLPLLIGLIMVMTGSILVVVTG
jgi:drug/metabolite transporter (DMT)-like permease